MYINVLTTYEYVTFTQSSDKWERMMIKPIHPPQSVKIKGWNYKLDEWAPYSRNEKVYLYKEKFIAQPRRVQWAAKKTLPDHYPSCDFLVVFMTPKHCEAIRQRDAYIEAQETLKKDETLQKIDFPIPGHDVV